MPVCRGTLRLADASAWLEVARAATERGVDVGSDLDLSRWRDSGRWSGRLRGREAIFVAAASDHLTLNELKADIGALLSSTRSSLTAPRWASPVDDLVLGSDGLVIEDYLLTHSSRPDDALGWLAWETSLKATSHATMRVSHDEGLLLTLLSQSIKPRFAVEVGTFTGYSSICIARGLAEGGRLLTCDLTSEWIEIAREAWDRALVTDLIDFRLGAAIDTLRSLPPEPSIDFAFIDADKEAYPSYYDEIAARLRPGGLLLIDNVFLGGRVFDPAFRGRHHIAVRELNRRVATDPRMDVVMIPVRDGLTIARRHR